jgi:hypothetical protein
MNMQPTCRHLRHKMMYVDDAQRCPGLVDDSSDTRVFFCVLSGDPLGPDGQPVSPDECDAKRACFCKGRPA